MARWAFLYDQTKCIGCNACQIACKDRYNLEKGVFFRRAETLEYECSGKMEYMHFSGSCNHCGDPACVKACPSGAMYQTEEGLVLLNEKECIGCGSCVRACPYGAPTLSRKTGKAVKCNTCTELREQGEEPVCVSACLTHCLQFADMETVDADVLSGYEVLEYPFLPDTDETKPSTRIKKRKKIGDSVEKGTENSPEGGKTIRLFRINKKEFQNNKKEKSKCEAAAEEKRRNPEKDAVIFQMLSCFFENTEKAMSVLRLFPQWKEHTPSAWRDEYDALFCGTDCDRVVPLWASVSKGEQVLLNQTTLDVIRFYYKYGYRPVWMEGNPPDFIGEQLRFMVYLCTAAEDEASERFVQEYLRDTVHMVCKAVRKQTDWEAFLKFADELEAFMDHGCFCSSEFLENLSEKWNAGCWFSDVREKGLYPEIPVEEPHVEATGGLNNCGGICVIRPEMAENCMLNIRTDVSENAPQIRACVRGRGYRKTFLHPGRLRYPMKRVGERGSGRFRKISWEEAVDLIAENWRRIRGRYGPGSTFSLYATGVTGIMRPKSLMNRLLCLDGGYLDYFNSYSSACTTYVSPYMFGTHLCGNSPADLLNTRLLILWGDNPVETIFGSERNFYLSKLKEHEIPVIVIDPRMSQTAAAYADEWIPIRPGTDSALADGMAYVIWTEGLRNQPFMDTYCLGFDEEHMPDGVSGKECYRAYLFGEQDGVVKNPKWAEGITGVPAETIRRIAHAYGSTHPACIISGLGPQRHGNGEQTTRSVALLSALTGNVGISGGGTGACGEIEEHQPPGLYCERKAENPYPAKIPVFLWTKAIEHGTEMTPEDDRLKGVERLDSNIKMIFNLAGDVLINQHSDINDTIRILKDDTKCEFIVTSDLFMTPSARFSDLVLPGTSVFEGENIVAPWRGSNYLLKQNQMLPPLFQSRFEWEWMKELAKKLDLYDEFVEGKPEVSDWLTSSYETLREAETGLPDYETFSRLGGWQYKDPICYIAFEKEIADPKRYPFRTPSGKIEIYSKALEAFHQKDIPAIPKYVPCPEGAEDPLREKYPLQLIGWHTRRRCHSIHDNNEWMDEVEMPGLWIHPDDAAARGISDGDLIKVYNDRGCVEIPAAVTKRICTGVVAMSQGGWYTPDQKGTDRRGSINILTSAKDPTPLAKGNPQHTNLVQVERCETGN